LAPPGCWLVDGREVCGVFVRDVEGVGGALRAVVGLPQAVGQGVHGVRGVWLWREGVDAQQPSGVLLALCPAGELIE
jgi:hypothetical protein